MNSIYRKLVCAGITALAIGNGMPVTAKTIAPPPPFPAWLEALKAEAVAKGVGKATLEQALEGIKPIPRVIELDRRQPEFTLTLGSYFKNAISAKRIAMGKEMLKKHAPLLRRVFERYRVPPRLLVAVWGLESNYGQYTGVFPVVGALVTLSHDRRRATVFRQQLLAVLQLIDKGDFPLDVKGSWAGAMGNHQFIPSTYRDFAVDFDGDGKRDLWNSLPDIFASAANYLSRSGGKKTAHGDGKSVCRRPLTSGYQDWKLESPWRNGIRWACGRLTENLCRMLRLMMLRACCPQGIVDPHF